MSSAKELATLTRRAAERIVDEAFRAEVANAEDAIHELMLYSAGQFSLAQLAAMGHPYRRGGQPPQDPAIINRQTGLYAASWEQDGPKWAGDHIVTTIENTAPEAAFLTAQGTRKMIGRPIVESVAEEIRERCEERRRQAMERALR